MTRFFVLLLMVGCLFTACNSDTATTATTTTAEAAPAVEAEASDPSRDRSLEDPSEFPAKIIPTAASRLRGTSTDPQFIKVANKVGDMVSSNLLESVDLNNGQLTLKYMDSAEKYNTINSDSRTKFDASIFANYWASASRAEKVLSNIPATVLKDFEFVESVKVVLPTGKKVFNAVVTRESLSKLTGKSWEELSKNWDALYQNAITRSPEGRKKFMKEVVK